MLPYIQIFNRLIPTYGIFFILSIFIVLYIFRRNVSSEILTSEELLILISFIVGLGVVFSKITYILVTYSPETLLEQIKEGNYNFLDSGFVFYGGLLGGILGFFLGQLLVKKPFTPYLNNVIPLIPLGHSIGRLGCLFAGCCYGVEYAGIGAITVLNQNNEYISVLPTQLFESLFLFLIFLLLYTSRNILSYLKLLFLYLFSYSIFRFILEYFRGDSIRGIYDGLSTSQWISAGIFLISLLMVLTEVLIKNKKVNLRKL